MKIDRLSGLAVAILFLISVAACGTADSSRQVILRRDLPPDLPPPRFFGSANQVVDQLCAWARAHQVEFATDRSTVVYIHTTRAAGQRDYSKRSLLEGFLDGERIGVLIMEAGPQDLFLGASPDSLNGLQQVVTHYARWSFITVPDAQCTPNASEETLATVVRNRCVAVDEATTVPLDALTADFRLITFAVPIGGFRQRAHLTVLSLYDDGTLAGRSISARAYAGPLDAGQVSRACEPVVFPERFESVSAR